MALDRATIPGLIAWFDPSDVATVTEDPFGITSVMNKIGGPAAVQSVDARKPLYLDTPNGINGRRAFSVDLFQGLEIVGLSDIEIDYTIFAVVETDPSAVNTAHLFRLSSGNLWGRVDWNTDTYFYAYGTTNGALSPADASKEAQVQTWKFYDTSLNSVQVRKDGALSAELVGVANVAMSDLIIGNVSTYNKGWQGKIGEFLVVAGTLTDQEITDIETALQEDWLDLSAPVPVTTTVVPWVNPLDFGEDPRGDPNKDASVVLQAAFDFARTNGPPVVQVPEGDWYIHELVSVKNGTKLRGSGVVIRGVPTVFRVGDGLAGKDMFGSDRDILLDDPAQFFQHWTTFEDFMCRNDNLVAFGSYIRFDNARAGEGVRCSRLLMTDAMEHSISLERGGTAVIIEDIHGFRSRRALINIDATGSDRWHRIKLRDISGDANGQEVGNAYWASDLDRAMIRISGGFGSNESHIDIDGIKGETSNTTEQQTLILFDAHGGLCSIHNANQTIGDINSCVRLINGAAPKLTMSGITARSPVGMPWLIHSDEVEARIPFPMSDGTGFAHGSMFFTYDRVNSGPPYLNKSGQIQSIHRHGIREGSHLAADRLLSDAVLVSVSPGTVPANTTVDVPVDTGLNYLRTVDEPNRMYAGLMPVLPADLESGLVYAGCAIPGTGVLQVRIANITGIDIVTEAKDWTFVYQKYRAQEL